MSQRGLHRLDRCCDRCRRGLRKRFNYDGLSSRSPAPGCWQLIGCVRLLQDLLEALLTLTCRHTHAYSAPYRLKHHPSETTRTAHYRLTKLHRLAENMVCPRGVT